MENCRIRVSKKLLSLTLDLSKYCKWDPLISSLSYPQYTIISAYQCLAKVLTQMVANVPCFLRSKSEQLKIKIQQMFNDTSTCPQINLGISEVRCLIFSQSLLAQNSCSITVFPLIDLFAHQFTYGSQTFLSDLHISAPLEKALDFQCRFHRKLGR